MFISGTRTVFNNPKIDIPNIEYLSNEAEQIYIWNGQGRYRLALNISKYRKTILITNSVKLNISGSSTLS